MLGFSLTLALVTFCSLSPRCLVPPSIALALSLSAGWLSALCTDRVPDYSSGINEGLQGKLASVVDLVILNMALDHSRVNLPLTNRANDAHPKRCPPEGKIHPSLFIFLLLFSCVGLLVSSPAPTHLMFLLFNSLSFSTPTFTYYFLSPSFVTSQSPLTPAVFYSHLFTPGPPQSPDPQTEDPSGATLGVRPGQRTQRGRRLKRL